MQGQKEINLKEPDKVNATHKIRRFVKLNREKGAVYLINKNLKKKKLFVQCIAFPLAYEYSTAYEYLLCYLLFWKTTSRKTLHINVPTADSSPQPPNKR